MKKFYYYIFYRYTDYYAGGESSPHIGGCVLTTGVIWAFLLTLVSVILSALSKYLEIRILYITFIIILVPNMFILTNKKYLALKEQYKGEKHKKIKGWGVFFLFLVSITMLILTYPLQK